MNLWFIALLLLVVALIVGPAAMLRPKPAQRRKEALRMHASKQGVRFGLRKPPKLKTAIEEPKPLPAYYLTPSTQMQSMPTWMLIRTDYEHEGNFYQEWDWFGSERPTATVRSILLAYLPELPASVSVITQGEAGSWIYWSEKEGEELLDRLIKLLKELQATVDGVK